MMIYGAVLCCRDMYAKPRHQSRAASIPDLYVLIRKGMLDQFAQGGAAKASS